MTTVNYLKADINDIIFEGRVKDYGAYDIRNKYERNVRIATLVACIFLVLAFISPLVIEKLAPSEVEEVVAVQQTRITELAPPPPMDENTPPPPPVTIEAPKIAQFVPPKLTDKQVVDEIKTNEEIMKAPVIGQANVEGSNLVLDPGVSVPKKTEIKVPEKVKPKIEAIEEFVDEPAAYDGYVPFLNKNLRYPDQFSSNPISGEVVIQFVVERDGQVTQANAVKSTNEVFKAEALRVMRLMPAWKPGKADGKAVRSRQEVRIKFIPPN
ncbi:MAG: TonB family protein [Bacteroidota bacterium]|nr:TonB family protein [Bacteroidota bacterium]